MNSRRDKRKHGMTDQKPNAVKNTGNPAEHKESGVEHPSSPTPMPSCEIHSPKANEKCDEAPKNDKHWLDYATGTFAFIAAIGAIAAAVFTGCQVWIAKDTEKRQLRAYIGLVPPADNQVANAFIPPVKPIIRLTPQNFGLTPASKAVHETGMSLAPYPLPKSFGYPIQKLDTPPNPITIYPGPFNLAGIIAGASRSLTDEEIASIQDGKTKRLYVYGTITYTDAFREPHFTNFCISFYKLTRTEVQREPCNEHNDSD